MADSPSTDSPAPAPEMPTLPPTSAPSAPPKPTRRYAFDAEIERQLEDALAGMDEKALLGEPEGKRPAGAARPSVVDETGEAGKKLGKVISIHGDDLFIDVGGRSQGVLSASQFPEGPPAIGAQLEVNIEGYDDDNGLLVLSLKGSAQQVDWSSVAEGIIVEARVTGTNKGGLEVEVNSIRGFIPISQIELFRVEDTKPYVNQRFLCLVAEVNPSEKNLVLSRRALLEKEREESREKLWTELAEGQIRTGTVRSVKDFGAFVDLGGVDGLLHVSQMSWARVQEATSLVQPGQQLQVAVLKIDQERRKVSLGLKQLLPSPWEGIEANYPPNSIVNGKVTRLADFGAFVELEPGLEGLIHISELATRRVHKASDVVQEGQEVRVRVIKVDPVQKRISLSLKFTEGEAEEAQAAEESPEKKPPRPRKTPLKGGLSAPSFDLPEASQ